MNSDIFLNVAKNAIIANRTADEHEQVELVWYAYELGNIKALFVVIMSDGEVDDKYYEATYRKETDDIWIDSYVKHNTIKL